MDSQARREAKAPWGPDGQTLGHQERLKACIVNYADDLVICCHGNAQEALAAMCGMMTRMKLMVNEATDRRSASRRSLAEVVADVSRKVSGWANYFSLGSVSKAYRIVDAHVGGRLCVWLNHKHRTGRVGAKRFIDAATAERLGLVRLQGRRGSLPWAKA